MSRKPLSSTNTRWAPRRAAFFYPGPRGPLPPGNSRFVPLDGPPFGFLTAPAQAGQDFPHVRRMIANAKLLADQRGHSGQRPEIGAVPGPHRPVAQQRDQLRFLAGRQARRAPRGRLGAQSPGPLARVRLPPAVHRTHRGGELARHRRQRVPGFYLRDRLTPPSLQLLGCPGWSHASYAVTRPSKPSHYFCKPQ